jgi:hypothetical protein
VVVSSSASGAAVGAILALGGVVLIAWGITGAVVKIRGFNLDPPPATADAGGITRKTRMKLALAFGIALVIAGVALALYS